MKNLLRKVLSKTITIPYQGIRVYFAPHPFREVMDYVLMDCPPPAPHFIKSATLAQYALMSGYRNFIETGTFMGNNTILMNPLFDRLYTIEMSDKIYEIVAPKLAKYSKIKCIKGNSAEVLPEIIKELNGPAVFWLDAHASGGDTTGPEHDPLYAELTYLSTLRSQNHVVLVDDARGLGVTHEQLVDVAKKFSSTHHMTMCNDIIRIVPKHLQKIGKELYLS